MNTDRIEKTIVLRAPRSTVWRALTTADEFGAWFGARLTGTFAPGARIAGAITAKGYEHLTMEIVIERVEPEHRFSYRWHPYAIDPKVDYSAEPATLCEFTLEEIPGGTRLTVVESGFDRIPASRRDEAFRMNDRGWAGQLGNIERYLAAQSDTPA
jgi:uncharacterized protein YndB with AHSA1/START domain